MGHIPTRDWCDAAQDAAEWNQRANSARPLKFQREARLADVDVVATTTVSSVSSHDLENRVPVVATVPNRGGKDARNVLADGPRRGDADADAAGDAAAQQGPWRSNRLRRPPPAG